MYFRPSQWVAYVLSRWVTEMRNVIPAFKHWTWYCFRRGLFFMAAKYAIGNFWLCFKKRKLGVTYARELAMMYWLPSNFYYDLDLEMRMFIRKCGYHYSPAGIGLGKKVQPWFYGDIKDDTKEILEKMEAKAIKVSYIDKTSSAEELQTVGRILRNFKQFTNDEIMMFFKKSELMTMELDDIIFGYEDKEEYFYGVLSGEIHLYAEGIGGREYDLIKVADCEENIVSLLSFLTNFAIGPQTYGESKVFAKCGAPGKYFRLPIVELINYAKSDKHLMVEILSNILMRQNRFTLGFNDLTGILPRMHTQNFLDANYVPINAEVGILTNNSPIASEAFASLDKTFRILKEDRKLCWVGVLDSRTILLRRYKTTHFAFYIHRGLVACTVSKLRRSYNAIQFYLSDGQIVGWREAVTGMEMAVQYQVADGAKALIIAIPDFVVRKYFESNPYMVEGPIRKILERHSVLNRQINLALKYTHRNVNEPIFRKVEVDSEKETYAYLCLSGRCRFILESGTSLNKGKARYGINEKGDWFGLVGMYTDSPTMQRTFICDRLTEYVAVPRYLINVITSAFREAAGYQCDYLARQIHRDHEHTFLDTDKMADSRYQINSYGAHTWRTYGMVCIYPAATFIPGKIYCDELARHHTCSVKVVTRADALSALQYSEFTMDNEYYLAKWLMNQEDGTTILLVLASPDFTDNWNDAVAKLCDMIQVLVTYELPHKPDESEDHMLRLATKARKEIVFIHPVVRVTKPQVGHAKFPHLPHGSILWLRPRSWVQRHHHVRMLDSAIRYMRGNDPNDLEQYMKDTKDPDKHSDYARVMRWISGESVGVVLGGGGAKGAAQVGALHYLNELNIPVDYICGVSIGSFLGALYAVFENIDVVEQKARELWEELKNPIRYARDFTYSPLVLRFSAFFRGHSFNWMIRYFFESIQIEDLYIPYFCVSSDLHDSCSRCHMSGDLWFYVRASMTLTLVFPPQINQFDFHLLMDGGYSDLVPAMTMKRLGIRYMIAINIGSEDYLQTFNIGYHVSGLKCWLQSFLPYSIDRIPNYFEIWDAILTCSARNFIQIIKAMDEYCIYIRPNVNAYSGTDFQYYDEMRTLGYLCTKFKFGGLHLKNLPVHVIWYLIRFYTYPYVARSQAQMLQGFEDEDWDFAVNLMSKTQMFQRARTTFLKMNLTPYLTDVMEARSYLEKILQLDEMKNIDLHVPVLENFSRDDEKLDLVHAIGRMKEKIYMEDFETIVKRGEFSQKDLVRKTKTRVHAVASEMHDLVNARNVSLGDDENNGDDLGLGLQQTYSLKELYQADPTMFQAVASYHHLRQNKKKQEEREEREVKSLSHRSSEAPLRLLRTIKKPHKLSLPSLHSIITGFGRQHPVLTEKPTSEGQRLEDFRMLRTNADRPKDAMFHFHGIHKFTQIATLKELRRSYQAKGMTEL